MKNILLTLAILIAATLAIVAFSPKAYSPILTATATLDFGNTTAGNLTDLTVSVTGAAVGDCVMIGAPNGSISGSDNVHYFAWVSSANTVTVRFNNGNLLAAVNPASG